VSGTRTQQVFAAVAAGQTATLTVPVRVVATGEKQVLGSATLTDTPGLRLSRGFVLLLNAEPKPLPKTQVGKDQKGQPLIIYEGGKH